MKKAYLIVVLATIVVGTGSTLAMMNNACKSGHHPWCAPISETRHHAKPGPS